MYKFLDAQAAMGFVLAQTTHIERAVNEIVYPDIQYPSLVPVDTTAHPWVKSVTYFSGDKVGEANWVNGNADDVPKASAELTKFETSVHTAAIGYGYGLEEISQAQMLGINLDGANAQAARRAYEEFMDRLALFGDARKGFTGLVNAPNVTAGTAVTTAWTSATNPQAIVAEMNKMISGQYQGTLFTAISDTVILPYSKWLLISTMPFATNGQTNETVLSWFEKNNVYTAATRQPLRIVGMRGLDTIGAGATARMVAYRRDPLVVKLHIPMPHRFLPAYQTGPLRWDVPGIFRTGGVDVRQPLQFSYVDGI